MSPSDQPERDASPPTHEDIERVRQIIQKAGPWSYAELAHMIGFLEGLPLDQLPPPVQAQVSELLQGLSALMHPLLQQRIAACLQQLETLRQRFTTPPREGQGRQAAE